MTSITCYGGVNEIGGNKILVEDEKAGYSSVISNDLLKFRVILELPNARLYQAQPVLSDCFF